jgi:hypothetical protein
MCGQHGEDLEVTHPLVTAGDVLDGCGEIVLAVELARTLVDIEELLWKLAEVEPGRLREAIDAAGVVNR